MKKQRFTQEEWHDLWRDENGSNGSMPKTPEETNQVMRMLEQVEQATDEPLSQQDRDMIFERTWKWSALQESERISWFGWAMPLMLKPVYMFVVGVGVGVWLTVQYEQGNLDIAKDVQAEDQVIIENSIYQKTLKGKAVEEEFQTLEDPKIVITKAKEGSHEVKRAVHGTVDSGGIVMVLNLD